MSIEKVASLALAGKLAEAEKALGRPADYEGRYWLAYLCNATGRFDQALELALQIAEGSGDGRLASCALVTGASALRQMDRHLAARPLDESAMRLAPDDICRVHALIGLAADAVGLGRERECAELLEQATQALPEGDWRSRVRLTWVRCEHALLTGRARKAVTLARDALDRSQQAGARRHEAKSLLFLAFCLRDAGDGEWAATMRRARDVAQRIGAEPLASVAAGALPVRAVPDEERGAATGR